MYRFWCGRNKQWLSKKMLGLLEDSGKVTEVRNMKYMIRKLTPKECFRLMNYTDADYDKAAEVNSKTQLYKQAGNAIVKSCLMAIFSQLNIKGVKPWNKMTVEERQKLVNGC